MPAPVPEGPVASGGYERGHRFAVLTGLIIAVFVAFGALVLLDDEVPVDPAEVAYAESHAAFASSWSAYCGAIALSDAAGAFGIASVTQEVTDALALARGRLALAALDFDLVPEHRQACADAFAADTGRLADELYLAYADGDRPAIESVSVDASRLVDCGG